MADLTRDDFVINRVWYEGDKGGKDVFKCLDITISSGTAGGTSNQIPKAIFGMQEICEVAQRAANFAAAVRYWFMPDYDGDNIVAVDVEVATDADRGNPIDCAFATFPTRMTVKGKPDATY